MLTVLKHKKVNHENQEEEFDNHYEIALKLLGVSQIAKHQPIAVIRGSVKANIKDVSHIDPYNLLMIDVSHDEKIFIDGNDMYTRDELYNKYPFRELNILPESIFKRQQICVFEVEKTKVEELTITDFDEPDPIMTAKDNINSLKFCSSTGDEYIPKDIIKHKLLTKIFIGKEQLEDFKIVARTARGAMNISGNTKFLTDLITGGNTTLMIENSVVQVAEDIKAQQQQVQTIEEKYETLAEELKITNVKLEQLTEKVNKLIYGVN